MTQRAMPAVPESFYWTHESWGSALHCRPLEDIAPHMFTTRQLQLPSRGAWHQLAAAMGVDEAHLFTLNQVHGREVVIVRRDSTPKSDGNRNRAGPRNLTGRPSADVLVSNDPDVALVVRVADCVPVLVADSKTGVVGAAHAGWRGTAAGAAQALVAAMQREFGSAPADLVAAIGPSIGACCYEVGSDLVDAFAAAGHDRCLIDRWFLTPPRRGGRTERSGLRLDIWAANHDQLVLAGVQEENVYVSGLCTASNLDVLTSFRAEKEKAGRIVGAIRVARAA